MKLVRGVFTSPNNMILGGSWEPALGTWVPAQNPHACLFRQEIACGCQFWRRAAELWGVIEL